METNLYRIAAHVFTVIEMWCELHLCRVCLCVVKTNANDEKSENRRKYRLFWYQCGVNGG
jgi:hypothetical protein